MAHMCLGGDQQQNGIDFTSADLYLPVFIAKEASLLVAFAAEHCCCLHKIDTLQASFLHTCCVGFNCLVTSEGQLGA